MLPMGRIAPEVASGSTLGASHPAPGPSEEDEFETYLLLLLSDSNLPTGGFVASSGLESFHAHGLLHTLSKPPSQQVSGSGTSTKRTAPSQAEFSSATLSFARSTLHSYARSSFPFLARVHARVTTFLDDAVQSRHHRSVERSGGHDERGDTMQACLEEVAQLDNSYHTLLLNHVARRASKAQGIALLTLYSKAFAKPIDLSRQPFDGSRIGQHPSTATQSETIDEQGEKPKEERRIEVAAQLMDRLKMDVRRASAQAQGSGKQGPQGPQGPQGHLPTCWAVFAACLGISLRKSVYLHLFLQARSLFSSSIRLNTLGPYLAHQLMRFQMRAIVNEILDEMLREDCLSLALPQHQKKPPSRPTIQQEPQQPQQPQQTRAYTIDGAEVDAHAEATLGSRKTKPFRNTATMAVPAARARKIETLRTGKGVLIPVDDDDPDQGWAWDWPEEQDSFAQADPNGTGNDPEQGFWTSSSAPATTFPLGEIIQARHDQLHSRLFNS